MIKNMKSKLVLLASALAMSASMGASAQSTGTDYGTILAGLDNSTAIAAVIGAGVLLAGVGFAKWGTKKVATFFG